MDINNRDRRDAQSPVLRSAVIAFMATAVLACLVIWKTEQYQMEIERNFVGIQTISHAAAIKSNIDRALSATYPLAALVRESKGNPKNFEALAERMLPMYKGASSLQLAPNGVVRQLVPLHGNEKAIGHDLLKDLERDKEAFLARDTGKLTLAGPFKLVQGGFGAAGRLPVYLESQANASSFWGFVTVLIRFPEVFGSDQLDLLAAQGHAFELWKELPETGRRLSIATSGSTLVDPVNIPIKVPNSIWMLSVSPIDGWIDKSRLAGKVAAALLTSALLGWVASLQARDRRHRQNLESGIKEATADLSASEERLRLALGAAKQSWFDLNIQTGEVTVSAEFPWLLGYTSDNFEFSFQLWKESIHSDDHDAVIAAYSECLVNGGPTSMEYRLLAGDKRWVWMSSTGKIAQWGPKHEPLRMIGIHADITERKKAERSLAKSERRFRDVANISADWIWEVDATGSYTYASEGVRSLLGYEPKELVGKTAFDLMPKDEGVRVKKIFDAITIRSESFQDLENIVLDSQGGEHFTLTSGNPIFDLSGQLVGYRGIDRDVTKRKALENELKRQARIDYLTGASNRGFFMEQAEQELNRAVRYDKQFSVLMMDIDFFKQVNDNHGHKLGDRVLVQLLVTCRQTLREVDVIGRVGGEEFAILLPETGMDKAIEVAERLRVALAQTKVPLKDDDQPLHLDRKSVV